MDVVVGTRPNMMKAAPLARALLKDGTFGLRVVHTGQHYDEQMSAGFVRDLGLPEPEINLGIGSGDHGSQTGRILEAYERVLQATPPAGVIVLGDVNSTLAGALAAVKLHIPCAHVEAGLRSFDRQMPEEINRLAVDAICDLLFATEPEAAEQLRKEGHPESRVHLVGNLMIDSVLYESARLNPAKTLSEFGVEPKGFYLATLHRPSNVDDPATLRNLVETFDQIAETRPVLFAAHPRTRARMEQEGISPTRARLIPPQPYHSNIALVMSAKGILSDSGGMQSESTVLDVPCLLLRDTTEQPIVLTHGTTELVHNHREKILDAVGRVEAGQWKHAKPIAEWDGKAGERIAALLANSWS